MAPPLVNKITRSMSCLDISSRTRFSASSLVTGTSSQLSATIEGLTGPPSTFSNCRAAFLILRSMNLSPLTPDASLVGLFSSHSLPSSSRSILEKPSGASSLRSLITS